MTANDRLIQLKGRLTTYYGEKSVNDKYRDIYFAKYYGRGWGEKNDWLGEKNENEELGKKIKKEKEKRRKIT